MSFVGTRPEAVRYIKKYKPEYTASLTALIADLDLDIKKQNP